MAQNDEPSAIGLELVHFACEMLGDGYYDNYRNRIRASGCLASLALAALGMDDEPAFARTLASLTAGEGGKARAAFGQAKRASGAMTDDPTTATALWIMSAAAKADLPLLSPEGLRYVLDVLGTRMHPSETPLFVAHNCLDGLLCAQWDRTWDPRALNQMVMTFAWYRPDVEAANRVLLDETVALLPADMAQVATDVLAGRRPWTDASDLARRSQSAEFEGWRVTGTPNPPTSPRLRAATALESIGDGYAKLPKMIDTPIWGMWGYDSMTRQPASYAAVIARLRELIRCPSVSETIAACDHDPAMAKKTHETLPYGSRLMGVTRVGVSSTRGRRRR